MQDKWQKKPWIYLITTLTNPQIIAYLKNNHKDLCLLS